MTDPITVDDATALWGGAPTSPSPVEWRLYRPLADAASEFAHSARNMDGRFTLGVDVLDRAMRGIGPGELCIVQGYAHQGKTVLLTHAIQASPDARIALFTPDETREMVLCKLASMVHGVSAEELERRIKTGDDRAEQLLVETATLNFPNLAVFDSVADVESMRRALGECQDVWGEKANLVAFDYAQLLRGTGGDDGLGSVLNKFDALKEFGKDEDVPLIVLHQGTRGRTAGGAEIKIDSGAYGGEQHATFVIGVRRKRAQHLERVSELEERLHTATRSKEAIEFALLNERGEAERHANSITFNLVKNKRPPGRSVDEIDFHLDPDTGVLSEWTGGAVTSRRPEPVDWEAW